ncbi:SRPBCC family protein [Pseudomonas sp. KNUC1026]|uniref:SRPBCC family protein n=1 Tax=Pseudomonas sp. KNUC1026 TaxID=2893890 RepID=UPI001F2B5CBD|nr:SRPBCC family protein [Pseudomonas sp. KNUC1026]UFH50205.1 hypothetical protein LN139_02450 [Pseudomonas sp. KNUC1026]
MNACSHSVCCDAPAATVYGIIRDSAQWPLLFEPCQAVTAIERGEQHEVIRVSAMVDGKVMNWCSRRAFDDTLLSIQSHSDMPMDFIKAMSVTWKVISLSAARSLLVLEHLYQRADVASADQQRAAQEEASFLRGLNANSTTELGNIRDAAYRIARQRECGPAGASSQSLICQAPADEVFALVSDTSAWPGILSNCDSAVVEHAEPGMQVVRIDAHLDGKAASWLTRRTLLEGARRVDFELLTPMPLLKSMTGTWRVIALDARTSLLQVDRRWQMVDQLPDDETRFSSLQAASQWFDEFVAGNGLQELTLFKRHVEGSGSQAFAVVSEHRLAHHADAVFAALRDIQAWPEYVQHCQTLDTRFDNGLWQAMSFSSDVGAQAEVQSVRWCDPLERTIEYFQPVPPAVMARHTGRWKVVPEASGRSCTVRAEHEIELCDGMNTAEQAGRVSETVTAHAQALLAAIDQRLAAARVAA